MSTFRRRQMMAAAQSSQSYVDWLKSIGCVVYLPLDEEGDLQDKISGLSLQLTGYGSMVWSSSEGMYKIKTPSAQFQYVAALENGMTNANFPSNSFTAMTSFKKITNSGYPSITQISLKSTDDYTITAFPTNYNASANIANFPSYMVKLARSENDTERKYYQQGTLYTTIAPAPQILPNNWVCSSGGGMVIGMVRKQEYYYTNKEYYIKDIYLFNGNLTLEQIRKIQGYD